MHNLYTLVVVEFVMMISFILHFFHLYFFFFVTLLLFLLCHDCLKCPCCFHPILEPVTVLVHVNVPIHCTYFYIIIILIRNMSYKNIIHLITFIYILVEHHISNCKQFMWIGIKQIVCFFISTIANNYALNLFCIKFSSLIF